MAYQGNYDSDDDDDYPETNLVYSLLVSNIEHVERGYIIQIERMGVVHDKADGG